MKIDVNENSHEVNVPATTPLLWVLREELKLKGTKFGCGRGICGACTVHLNGVATRTCILPVAAAQGAKITTIDSYPQGEHPVQKAWIKHSVPQCGYCQSGQIMQAIGLLNSQSSFSQDDLVAGIDSNLCRCGTYNKIKDAIFEAAEEMGKLA